MNGDDLPNVKVVLQQRTQLMPVNPLSNLSVRSRRDIG